MWLGHVMHSSCIRMGYVAYINCACQTYCNSPLLSTTNFLKPNETFMNREQCVSIQTLLNY